MMDTFHDLIEANLGNLISSMGTGLQTKITDAGKMTANLFLRGLGSSRAAGRLDLNLLLVDLRKAWKYYVSQQGLPETAASMVDFLQTVFGLRMDEDSLFKSLYGTYTDDLSQLKQTPNSNHIHDEFSQIIHAGTTPDQIEHSAEYIAHAAKGNRDDATYVIKLLKWIGANHPEILKLPEMSSLASYMHGGALSVQQVDKLLTSVAQVMLKRQTILQRVEQEAGEQPAGTESSSTTSSTPNTDGQNKQSSTTDKISLDPPSTQERPNWGGLIRPVTISMPARMEEVVETLRSMGFDNLTKWLANPNSQWERFVEIFANGMQFQKINALSAHFMPYVVRNATDRDFISAMDQIQSQNGAYWPKANYSAAYQFAHDGGNSDEITAELNHFASDSRKAAIIFVALIELVAKTMQKSGGTE